VTDTVLSAYAGDLTQMLSTLSGMSARPAFNLAFANLQNAMASRYNDEVTALQQKALDSYDGSLDKELAKLQEQLPKLESYQTDVAKARALILDRVDNLSDLTSLNSNLQFAAANGEPVDPTAYNAAVDNFNEQLKIMPFIDGNEFGFYGDDGTGNLRLNGIGLEHFSADDNNTETGATYNLSSTLEKLNNTLNSLGNRVDVVSGEVTRIQDRISEIQDHQQKSAAEIKANVAQQVQQKKLLIAEQLQAVSIGFEASQASSDQMVKAFSNDTYQVGSVVNLFS
jgi:hypothetical protein